MASEIQMPNPVCLIENKDRKLVVHQEALQLLSGIHQPVVVVAIVGLYRTGKSYLMNKLAGKNSGFPLGSTVQANTKGIWMWCVPYPGRPGQTLVLLDTEGLGDVEKGDLQNDSWIFALAVLLSSTLVYNSMGTIDQHAMEQLHYVTELTERIKSKSSPTENSDALEDSSEYVRFFPTFIWAVRDFSLQLELNGQPCTEDEYLENALKLKKVLATLVATYVDMIRSGGVPCMESAVQGLAKIENSAAVHEATVRYVELMDQKLKLPTENLQELLGIHANCEDEALKVFMARSFKDDQQEFQAELMAEAEVEQFFKDQEAVGRGILQSDEALTKKEKEAEDARARAEAAEREKEIQKQQNTKLEQKMEDQIRSHEANIQYLKEKMEKDREKLLEEQNRVMESKLREERVLLQAGCPKCIDHLYMQIDQLRKEIENLRKPWELSRMLEAASMTLPLVLPDLIGKVLKRGT